MYGIGDFSDPQNRLSEVDLSRHVLLLTIQSSGGRGLTGRSSWGLVPQCRHSKCSYSESTYSKQLHKHQRLCQGDMARWIQKDFQELSPGYLKNCDLSDLLSEECSSLDKPMRFGWPGCVGRRKCMVIHMPLELDAQESGRRAELRWKKGLHHHQCHQDW